MDDFWQDLGKIAATIFTSDDPEKLGAAGGKLLGMAAETWFGGNKKSPPERLEAQASEYDEYEEDDFDDYDYDDDFDDDDYDDD